MRLLNCLFLLFFLSLSWNSVAQPVRKDTLFVENIWDKAAHNAFPDLFLHNNEFYCTVREAPNHVDNTNAGKVRVIKSKNGLQWRSVALFDLGNGIDIREARLSLTPKGQLLATVAAGIFKDGRYLELKPYVSFSDNAGEKFSPLEPATFGEGITPTLDWIWRITWEKGIGYGVMYTAKYEIRSGKVHREMTAQVVKTTDGKRYDKVSDLDVNGDPNESTIRFDENSNMYVLIRRETDDQKGVLAISSPPYQNWTFQRLPFRLGGPNFIFLNNDRLLIGSRFHEDKTTSTALHVSDLKGNILKTVKLPSGGDNSYPGLVKLGRNVWIAYYSGHKGKTSIYLTKMTVSELLNTK